MHDLAPSVANNPEPQVTFRQILYKEHHLGHSEKLNKTNKKQVTIFYLFICFVLKNLLTENTGNTVSCDLTRWNAP